MAEPTTTPAPSVAGGAFIFILIMVAFDFLAFGIIAPVLPDLIRQFEGGDFARASSITGYFGFAAASFPESLLPTCQRRSLMSRM